jgi:hypothetical protein
MTTAGEPLLIQWNRKTGVFRLRFRADGSIASPTVLYLPEERFGSGAKITSPLRFEFKPEEQRLLVYNDGFGGEAEVEVMQ